jgi:hypothetical protein
MFRTLTAAIAAAAALHLAAALDARAEPPSGEGWISLFNGKDTAGWKLRNEKVTITKFVDADGKTIVGARKARLDQKEVAVDAKGKAIDGAKIELRDNKKAVVDADGKPIAGAKVAKVGGRDAIVGKDGNELRDAKAVNETFANDGGGWVIENGELICGVIKPGVNARGSDLYTEQKFTDFELYIEFQGTSNSGVYLQGRYEIQVDNSVNARPKVIEKDGKRFETLDTHQCGAIYGFIAPSRNMARPPREWQSYRVVFRGARGEGGKVAQKARVTLVWNGEKVIDDAEIPGATGAAMDSRLAEPGPLMLQGDHGRVAYRNIKIRPLPATAGK